MALVSNFPCWYTWAYKNWRDSWDKAESAVGRAPKAWREFQNAAFEYLGFRWVEHTDRMVFTHPLHEITINKPVTDANLSTVWAMACQMVAEGMRNANVGVSMIGPDELKEYAASATAGREKANIA